MKYNHGFKNQIRERIEKGNGSRFSNPTDDVMNNVINNYIFIKNKINL
jgi:hypothetical protein